MRGGQSALPLSPGVSSAGCLRASSGGRLSDPALRAGADNSKSMTQSPGPQGVLGGVWTERGRSW